MKLIKHFQNGAKEDVKMGKKKSKLRFGKWYPFNPFPLPIGTSLLNYVFTAEVYDKLPKNAISEILTVKGFKHPSFCRTNKFGEIKFVEFMCIYPLKELKNGQINK